MVLLPSIFVAFLAIASLVDADGFCRLDTCDPGVHTMCQFSSPQPSRQCGAYKDATVTPAEKKELLDVHNKLRARVASGQETRGIGGPQPAGIIPPLSWDEELAVVAQRWANQCHFGHDSCRNVERFRVGQNVAYEEWSGSYNTKLSTLVNNWYDEVEQFDRRIIPSYQYFSATGHYTQMVWGKTTKVGCGVIRHPHNGMFRTYLVCNYADRGNIAEQPIYETGRGGATRNQHNNQRNPQRYTPISQPRYPNQHQNVGQNRNPQRNAQTFHFTYPANQDHNAIQQKMNACMQTCMLG
ncbi:venom allergen 5-like [Diachasmimorpha longicaudata]|uniref:venom allergen 5-like n=1 Tax=Diachasmimorpha longicaudata TaxID=58733 RepID=UPI0030B902A6